jgi:hypothetical protein
MLKMPTEFAGYENDTTLMEQYFQWIRFKSQMGSMRLNIDADVTEVKKELSDRSFLAIPHRKDESNMWRVITLYGYSSIITDSPEYLRENNLLPEDIKLQWTDISPMFPKTVEWVKKNIPLKTVSRIRVMVVDPGGYIMPHRDYHHGQCACAGINIAIVNPEGAEFCLEENGLIPWEEGDVRVFDVGRYHCIRNNGNIPRIHLIVSPLSPEWDIEAKRLACDSYTMYSNKL